jgi:ribokinase
VSTKNTTASKVYVIGSVNIDWVASVDRLPEPGETLLSRSLETLPGGKGANQALAAAAGGADVDLVGRFGDDADGQRYARALAKYGVGTRFLLPTPGIATGRAFITVSLDGENQIVVHQGANGAVSNADIDAVDIVTGSVALLQLELPIAVVSHAAWRWNQAGARVVLNPSPFAALAPELLELADPLIVNEHEAHQLANLASSSESPRLPEMVDAILARGPRSVVVSLGAEGAIGAVPGARFHVRVPRVDVVDTTGAGDVLAGTIAAQLARGSDLHTSVSAGVAAASLATTWAGAHKWRFSQVD